MTFVGKNCFDDVLVAIKEGVPICLASEGVPMYGLSRDAWNTCDVLRCW